VKGKSKIKWRRWNRKSTNYCREMLENSLLLSRKRILLPGKKFMSMRKAMRSHTFGI
jgi:hypothetical protein